MDAIKRTESLQRVNLPINNLHPNEGNPNEMTEREFNLLYDKIERMGVTDAILVRPFPEKGPEHYKIVGGHHRWEVAKLHGFEDIPCTIVTDPDFDDDQEQFQLMRHNLIRGKMSPQKFIKLYEKMSQKYADEILAESFGFADEEEFQKLIRTTAKALPKEMQEQFKAAAKEIKTIDGLANLLNSMFSQHGDTLPYGYMVVDFGGKESIWLRMKSKDKEHFNNLTQTCRELNCTVDSLMSLLMRIAGTEQTVLQDIILSNQNLLDPVPETFDFTMPPTEENIEANTFTEL